MLNKNSIKCNTLQSEEEVDSIEENKNIILQIIEEDIASPNILHVGIPRNTNWAFEI